ncbi:Protein Transport Protein Sec24D [Manis pentadactyla]|nr:Protein Transport Protein Sec24D [Manis pentadactyla]
MPRGLSARSYAHARWGRRSLTGGKTRCREPEQGWRCGAGSGGGQLGDPAGSRGGPLPLATKSEPWLERLPGEELLENDLLLSYQGRCFWTS